LGPKKPRKGYALDLGKYGILTNAVLF
jgi:hypothetical protein